MLPKIAQRPRPVLARTLFRGSDLVDESRASARQTSRCSPTMSSSATSPRTWSSPIPISTRTLNRHTSPQLDGIVAELRADRDLKVEAQRLKHLFAAKAETLLHGDLHTGSVMVTDDGHAGHRPGIRLLRPDGLRRRHADRQFLDGLFLAVRPRDEAAAARRACAPTCSTSIVETWAVFRAEFSHLWRTERNGMLYQRTPVRGSGRSARRRTGARPTCCTTSGPTCWASPASRSTAASSASPIMPISRPSPTRTCAPGARRKALKLGRHLAVNRRRIHGIAEVNALAARHREGDSLVKVGDRHYRTIWLERRRPLGRDHRPALAAA